MSEITTIDVVASTDYEIPDFNYELITNEEDREWAEYAAGSIRFGLGQAVLKVLTAGNMLMEAKSRLPHGQYLPWVEQACGLKPSHAQKLIKAAEWANAEHAQHLDGITDTTTLFLLSADATPEDVRQWAMERCAAGSPPSRKEVQERKRQASGARQPRTVEAVAVSIIRKGELDRMREAVALAEQAQVMTSAQVLDQIGLRQLPNGGSILGAEADFFKLSDGQWVRIQHNGQVDVEPCPEPVLTQSIQAVSFDRAAQILGCAMQSIKQRISPKQISEKGTWYKNGYRVTKGARGLVNLEPQP
jgi:predicted HTH domain antitoxin